MMYSTALCVNGLLEYKLADGKLHTERILWITPCGDSVVTIDVDRKNKHALPIWKTREEIETALTTGYANIIDNDPWAVLLNSDINLSEKSQEKRQQYRDRAWKAIEPLVKEKNARLFDPRQRGPLIADQARKKEEDGEEKKERKGFIYDALRRYWQGGQTKNALLPFFDECGAEGKERVGKKSKLGRPSALARIGETSAGIIMTADVRSKLLRGYKKYFVSGKEKTLEKALQRTREDFFNAGFDEKEIIDDEGKPKKNIDSYFAFC